MGGCCVSKDQATNDDFELDPDAIYPPNVRLLRLSRGDYVGREYLCCLCVAVPCGVFERAGWLVLHSRSPGPRGQTKPGHGSGAPSPSRRSRPMVVSPMV